MGTQYKATLENLRLINSTVTSMMGVVTDMHTMLSSQLNWLVNQLGGAQDGLRVLTTLVSHAAFLFVSILFVLFVKAPAFTRLSLLIIVSLNTVVEIRYRVSLTFVGLSGLQLVLMLGKLKQCKSLCHYSCLCPPGNWLYLWYKSARALHHQSSLSHQQPALKLQPDHGHQDDREMPEPPETITYTPKKTMVESSPRGSSHLLSVQCCARTRTGLPCKLPVIEGSLCKRHTRYC